MKKPGTIWMYAVVLISLSGYMAAPIAAIEPGQDEPAPIASGVGGVIEGKVIEVESKTLVIEKNNGRVVRVHMPGKSGDASSDFKKGDYIEAAVTPEGMTTSIRIVPPVEDK